MKKLLLLISMFLLTQFSFAEEITYPDSWGKQGMTLLDSRTDGLTVNFSINRFSLEDMEINGEALKTLQLPHTFLPNDQGMPDLPGISRYLALPQDANVQFEVTASRTELFSDIDLAPAPRIPFDTEDGPLEYVKDNTVYNSDAYYPQNPVQISEVKKIRGVDVALLGITPFQYNPVTKELLVYRDIQVSVVFDGGNGNFGRDRLRNRSWDNILQDMLLNFSALPKMTYEIQKTTVDKTADVENVEYVIITPDDAAFLAWADSLKQFRMEQGINTGVISTTEIGGNDYASIKAFVDDAYNNWTTPPSAILLLGDYELIDSSVPQSHPYSGTYVSDNYYADVDGDDLPDIVFARITAENETHLQQTIGKMLDYERNPPTSEDFYNHPVTAMGWQTERWFQICSEVINGFWEYELGKEPVRENAIYSGNTSSGWSTATNTSTVVDYFGPSGLGYIPATPDHLTDWGGNATRVNADINSGAFMVQHRDHGSETSWGEPSYSISNMSGLDNEYPPFVFSVNCLTGEFNLSYECFAEAFHRDDQRALGLIAATQVSYSFVNDTYTWGLYDNMWPQFMPDEETTFSTRFIRPAFANAAGKYFLQQSNWPYNTDSKQITYYLFHHHGDAYLNVYSEVPQNLTVNHSPVLEANTTTYSVTADDESIIAFTANGEIIGTAEGTGAPVDITIPIQQIGDTVLVTITKQNYYRYSQKIPVIVSSGAYVTIASWDIDDSAGNNNQAADFSESILLNVDAVNQGSELAPQVTGVFSSTDGYITITDNSYDYGDIDTSETVSGTGAFAITVADSVPDQHSVACRITFSQDGGSQWISNLALVLNAPDISLASYDIDDSINGDGDGNLDEGETANFIFPVINNGHADAPSVEVSVTENSSYITITSSLTNIGTVAASDTVDAIFEVHADAAAPAGAIAEFVVTATSGSYVTVTEYMVTIGDKEVYIMESGNFTVLNGLFYDTGGPDGEFSTSEDITMTFFPAERSPFVKVNFTSFDLTSYDRLYIFDGSSTSDDQVAGSPFSGTTSPGEIVSSSSDGALTFMFRSNSKFTADGWVADIYSTAISDVEEIESVIVSEFALLPNYPNPFNPQTTIRYQLPEAANVKLTVYNMNGQRIKELVSAHQNSGQYSVTFDAASLSSGVYFYQLQAGSFKEMRKMILLK